jgi:hypothetical protein
MVDSGLRKRSKSKRFVMLGEGAWGGGVVVALVSERKARPVAGESRRRKERR